MPTRSGTAPVLLTPRKSADQGDLRTGTSLVQVTLRHLRQDRLTIFAIGILLTLALLSVLAPVISQYILHVDPTATDGYNHMLPIGAPGHILGTDNVGRDQQ